MKNKNFLAVNLFAALAIWSVTPAHALPGC